MDTTFPILNRQTARITTRYPERVVQFGGGNFLRAFVDWIIEALNDQAGFQSSVVIVKPTPQGSYEAFRLQEGLFHVQLHGVEDGKLVTEHKLITCASRAINPYSDNDAFLALACQPEIRFIVSNTTEAGLTFAPGDRLTDVPPASFPAKLTVFLYRRFQHFQANPDKGCIVLPCELVERNGDQLKQRILQYAELWKLEPDFERWIESNNLFCNTLVDRIVPGFPAANEAAVLERLGFNDQLVVDAERYHNWIIEAPPWLEREFPVQQTNLNIRIVDDVEPYRQVKVRILNGAHTAMMPLGYLLGMDTVQQATAHPRLGGFIHDLVFKEIVPSFKSSDSSLDQFAIDTLNRFQNPFIQHRLLSISLNSISKFKVRLLPSLTAYIALYDELPRRIVFAFAALLRFYNGDWAGKPIPLNDDPTVITYIQEQWRSGNEIRIFVENVLATETLWGQDLTELDGLVELLSEYLARIDKDGIEVVIENEDW